MRIGVRMGVDVGKARIGIARSDAHGLLATPVETIARSPQAGSAASRRNSNSSRTPRATAAAGDVAAGDIQRIAAIAQELDAIEILVGLPVSLSGAQTESTRDAVEFARALAGSLPQLTVRMVDERLSTVSAQQALRDSGRKSRGTRGVIDQVAAVIILQHALDIERASGMPPGSDIPSSEGS